MPRPSLPTYALYGEGRGDSPGDRSGTATDWLHCESIAARSQLHDWEIRPHRHETLLQILYIRRGRAQVRLDDRDEAVRGPFALTVPSLVPHGFRFEPGIDGWVFTVLETHLRELLAPEPALWPRLARPWGQRLSGPAVGAVQRSVVALQQAFADTAAWRGFAVDAALAQLAVTLARQWPEPSTSRDVAARRPERALAHVQRFRALVDARFRQQPTLAALAAEMGITPTQLNRVCHQVLGHAALGVLHQRLLLEAQRELTYTTLSIKQIAHDLGFADPGYFTRFFQRGAGRTPSAWRARRPQASGAA